MRRLHRISPEFCIMRCGQQGEWCDQLNVVMKIEPSTCNDADDRRDEQSKKSRSFSVFTQPKIVLVSIGHHQADRQWQAGYDEPKSAKEPKVPEHALARVIGNGPIESIAKDTLFPEDNCHQRESGKETGRENHGLHKSRDWF